MKKELLEKIIDASVIYRCFTNSRDPFVIAKALGIDIYFLDYDFSVLRGCSYFSKNIKEIKINAKYGDVERKIICAHELGHYVADHIGRNEFKGANPDKEHCANLFAVALLFDWSEFNCRLTDMSSYALQSILDKNLKK